ncbi:flagellar hook capping protein [Pleomorphomonas diazotrophica]|uniref:Basal-body rod modification protein FlgD n=1 Tax=Pleomorphomonas diazotrophica TaxID=1166257 RepID=A0A1I4UTC9_9HYPH|nr:flagellar hook capping FlgD N-terminal domain-containing protein [Pleomorphomonas diazotrophica]PKR89845.1 flagellar hook capping protein [Pleomorphomonas diazotrophica]SFM92212.1 flagellar basal-body rod modification protein FlgD [Pleomorphomonas diazotrophica]
MSVSGVGNSNATNTQSAATSSLTSNYTTFLTLLTTQLQTQSPLSPMDVNSFTQQLVQYSAVEQQIQTNANLQAMMDTLNSSAALQLVNYVGKTVTAYSDTTKLDGGKAEWTVNSSAKSSNATVTITDEKGAVVYQGTMDLKSGENTFTWDGKGTPEGDYTNSTGAFTISVSGVDDNGKKVTTTAEVTGKVQAVDTSSSQPYIKVNGRLIPLSALTQVAA